MLQFCLGEQCDNFEQVQRTLAISKCTQDEFTCDNGHCIPMGNRCNRRADCPDRSDERNCQIISIDETYFPEYPPLNPEGSISLRLDANIDAILDVAEVFEYISNAGNYSLSRAKICRWRELFASSLSSG